MQFGRLCYFGCIERVVQRLHACIHACRVPPLQESLNQHIESLVGHWGLDFLDRLVEAAAADSAARSGAGPPRDELGGAQGANVHALALDARAAARRRLSTPQVDWRCSLLSSLAECFCRPQSHCAAARWAVPLGLSVAEGLTGVAPARGTVHAACECFGFRFRTPTSTLLRPRRTTTRRWAAGQARLGHPRCTGELGPA